MKNLTSGLMWAVGGAIAISILGFSTGGVMTAGTAEEMVNTARHDATVAALVPICNQQAHSDPEFEAKLALITGARSWERDEKVMEIGWATMPGSTEPNRDVAEACVKLLEAPQA